ncbi:hypothetical protein [Streptomyces sp. NPDC058326]|uniref:hypothetical protein n=1 Tax=Streptomyces sp. NPDC058326 TaxID=3346447 RepID=UPI0036E9D2FF
MATPKRAEHTRDHVSMSELLASCVAAHTLSTPPRTGQEQDGDGSDACLGGLRDVRDEAA